MKTTNKKTNNRKKILPAAGMLAVSAAMLGTATFAWFTMSREVEVKNIKMTATVPEDLQISLGKLAVTGTPATAVTESNSATYSLSSSTGVLFASSGAAGDGNAATPENTWDWSNSADISAYYDFGRLIPASSYDGTRIFFTPDASGVGKTVKSTGNYIQATDTTDNTVAATDAGTGTNTTYKTTLHALTGERVDATAEGKDSWAATQYVQAAAYNKTNDDGYYVDIPVWIRTSSNQAVNVSVDGYVLPGSLDTSDNASNKETDLELYRAVRVALLDGENVVANGDTGAVQATKGAAAVSTAKNIIPLKDAWDTTKSKGQDGNYTAITSKADVWNAANVSILDSINLNSPEGADTRAEAKELEGDFSKTNANGGALAGVSALGTQVEAANGNPAYTPAVYTVYNPVVVTTNSASAAPDAVATIEGSTTGKDYGTPKKLIVRVWLDGEDGECWNDNAGQDWNISLKFSKIEAAASSNDPGTNG